MRPIAEDTLAILKSQNLIGQNRFSHNIMLEGYNPEYGNITSNKLSQWISNAASGLGDVAVRSDGKILVAYKKGKSIFVSHVDNESVLLDNPVAVLAENEQLIYTCTTTIKYKNFALLRLNNGAILLFITDLGEYGGLSYQTIVYSSISGLGNDFTYFQTIESKPRISSSTSYLNDVVGTPVTAKNGDIFICYMGMDVSGSYDFSVLNVYKSSDNGETWTRIYQFNFSLSIGVWSSRLTQTTMIGQVVIINNMIICTFMSAYGGTQSFAFYSEDYGATWVNPSWSTTNPVLKTLFPAYDSGFIRTIIVDSVNQNLYYVVCNMDNGVGITLYSISISKINDMTIFNNLSNWIMIFETQIAINGISMSFNARITAHNKLYFIFLQSDDLWSLGMTREFYSNPITASSISISKGKSGANTASIVASNYNGSLNPKNPDSPLYGIIGTNKQVIIKQGYGDDLIETFTGLVDGFEMSTWPQTTQISLRDNLKKALDQTITYGNQHTVQFDLQPIENIVGYLCYLAGIEVGDVEPTGIQVAKTFSWESYADAFQFLGDLASFEWGCDEYGKFYFRRDYQPDDMFVAYTFEEGVDITALNYSIKDDDLYYKVAVFGKSGETVIRYEAPFLDAASYNLMPQKILKIDATEATTMAELKKIAERAIALMQSRTAIVNFSCVAVPWLQVGDFIGVYERSTGAASIYRISSLKLEMDSDSFTMSIDAYYYGDSIVPGELPEETASQTVAPTTNLIPEMTSNTAPSGVARASSVYTSAYEPWQAFNSTNADNYWNSITNNGWIEYQFPQKTIVDKYTLKARQSLDYNDAMPKDWTLEGFDGEKWVVLDTRTNQTAWGVNEVRTYKFSNTTAYSKYRLNVSRNNGYIRLQLEQLAMYYGGGA